MLPFTKKIDQQIQHLGMAWEHNSGRGRGGDSNFESIQKCKFRGGGRGESWRFQVMDALYISTEINDPRKWGSKKKKKMQKRNPYLTNTG